MTCRNLPPIWKTDSSGRQQGSSIFLQCHARCRGSVSKSLRTTAFQTDIPPMFVGLPLSLVSLGCSLQRLFVTAEINGANWDEEINCGSFGECKMVSLRYFSSGL
ncbi:hypothetical protein NPIL_101541 [Nephila pilipes]|uniref:Uncharacterized protein n=1 Tax=Nephila pilipes TaxID=299642 RepID=A0A8X6PYD4_NEPPI|nr:hypothetical protein NPIL_101541 [Nephila pilipes]